MALNNSILLASGGLDSTTLAYWLRSNEIDFLPVFINYGQHCASTELETLRQVLPGKLAKKIEVIDVSAVYKYSQSLLIREPDLWNDKVDYKRLYLPYRSLLLLTVGASFAQSINCNNVYAAFINSNHAQEIDCSAQFFNSLETVFEDYGGVSIIMPFRYMSKYEVAQLGIELKAPIGKSFSCQASSDIPCGACPNCVDRLEAIQSL
ncbi:7-cyano-7-deazaguanine synthase [Fibrisoma montanum]|uniref:7-cyano-7-deazaguanine synthase n=1 Tax=Fibrisoma montanum TaxID=2305895 RepID=A0A418ME73_9BACT|nr:7-cyano-7-deazaguanine synthase [Fibrisoma montanum]RIV25119.1 7-cyano-7-deazaguanine synthase [Fibrisoma montanum]